MFHMTSSAGLAGLLLIRNSMQDILSLCKNMESNRVSCVTIHELDQLRTVFLGMRLEDVTANL